jgi:predicted transcriptional regulator
MKLEDIIKELNLKARCCENKLSNEIRGGYVSDLLSDVMANSQEGDVWITRQVHPNIVAVAVLKEHAGIILVQGGTEIRETLEKASKEGIPVLETNLTGFEVAGKLYRLINP